MNELKLSRCGNNVQCSTNSGDKLPFVNSIKSYDSIHILLPKCLIFLNFIYGRLIVKVMQNHGQMIFTELK